MEQEKVKKKLSEFQETELKEEKIKKIFIIIVVLLLFGGTCYYYAGINKHSSAQSNSSTFNARYIQNRLKSIIDKPKVLKQVQDNNNISSVKKEKISKISEETAPKEALQRKLKSADKSAFLVLKEKSSGKKDPFSYRESGFSPLTGDGNVQNAATFPGSLPPVPSSGNMGTLPGISDLSGVPSIGLAPPPSPKPEDLVNIKGFIGNKVIVEINGVVEALSANEKISDIKVLAINPSALTAEFEIKGKTVIKTMKSLIYEHNGDVQLVKDLHN